MKLTILALLIPLTASAAPTDDVMAAMKKADKAKVALDINNGDRARASSDIGKQCIAIASACNDAVDKALAAGATPQTILLVDGYKKVALGTVKPEYCAPLADLAASFDAQVETAKADRDAKLAAPFKAAGVTGDKLAWATRYRKNDFDFYGVGGAILKPAELARANVVFLITGDADHDWALHRFAFKGNKLVGETTETFIRRPGASKFR